jgi:hypothetical protein
MYSLETLFVSGIYVCINTLHKGDNDDDDDDNNNNKCYMEAKCSSNDPDCNIIYGSNSKVTIMKFKNT